MNKQTDTLNLISEYLNKKELLEFKLVNKQINKQIKNQLFTNISHRYMYTGTSELYQLVDKFGDCRVIKSVINDKRIKTVYVDTKKCESVLECESATALIIDSFNLSHISRIKMPNLKEIHIMPRFLKQSNREQLDHRRSDCSCKVGLISDNFNKIIDCSKIEILQAPLGALQGIKKIDSLFPKLKYIILEIKRGYSAIDIIFPASVTMINVRLTAGRLMQIKSTPSILRKKECFFTKSSHESTKGKKIKFTYCFQTIGTWFR